MYIAERFSPILNIIIIIMVHSLRKNNTFPKRYYKSFPHNASFCPQMLPSLFSFVYVKEKKEKRN